MINSPWYCLLFFLHTHCPAKPYNARGRDRTPRRNATEHQKAPSRPRSAQPLRPQLSTGWSCRWLLAMVAPSSHGPLLAESRSWFCQHFMVSVYREKKKKKKEILQQDKMQREVITITCSNGMVGLGVVFFLVLIFVLNIQEIDWASCLPHETKLEWDIFRPLNLDFRQPTWIDILDELQPIGMEKWAKYASVLVPT